MNNTIEYKGYIGSVEFSERDGVFYGKVQGIRSLISYEGTNAAELISDFHGAVDDYLEMCLQLGKSPSKTYNGIFNVRVSPDLHRRISYMAKKHGVTLNAYVNEALEYSLNEENEEYVVK